MIELVGPQYVTAVCTDNAANCKAAGDIIQVGMHDAVCLCACAAVQVMKESTSGCLSLMWPEFGGRI